MAWLVLVVSGMLEAVWATALGRSEVFSKPVPTVTVVVALVLSMAGLAYAMRTLPVGTSYAVWVGIGAVLTVSYAMFTGSEPVTVAKLVLLAGIVGCVVGLKVPDGAPSREKVVSGEGIDRTLTGSHITYHSHRARASSPRSQGATARIPAWLRLPLVR